MGNVKRIPYGVSNFLDIVQRNQYYVDKTMYIPKLEAEADSLFFIRPRRFGNCDFFFLPNLTHYASKHSYIIELKVLSKKDFESKVDGETQTKAEKQWQEAVEQINRYAQAPRVEALRQGTQLHKIIMQFEGWQLKRMEEIK